MTTNTVPLDGQYDYLIYVGAIERRGYKVITDLLESKRPNSAKKAYFVLVTTGGDADAAYRIARALGHYYPEDVRLFVPDICKSAGTLLAIGAKELIISDRGELGPLDVQFAKKDELFEMSSGLDVVKSLNVLKDEVYLAFREYLLDMRLGGGIGTKMASELASEMACGFVSPIVGQIDPLRLGEHQRAVFVATEYGRRLREKFQNISDGGIDALVLSYPSHSFVIDRKEAGKLFENVRAPSGDERSLEASLRSAGIFDQPSADQPHVFCYNDMVRMSTEQNSAESGTTETFEEKDNEQEDGRNTAAVSRISKSKRGTGT